MNRCRRAIDEPGAAPMPGMQAKNAGRYLPLKIME